LYIPSTQIKCFTFACTEVPCDLIFHRCLFIILPEKLKQPIFPVSGHFRLFLQSKRRMPSVGGCPSMTWFEQLNSLTNFHEICNASSLLKAVQM
jgi:hypothetical protein